MSAIMQKERVRSLEEALHFFSETLSEHPERNRLTACKAVMAGEKRRWPAIYLNHLIVPDDPDPREDDFFIPAVDMEEGREKRLAEELLSMLEPLKMLNPVTPAFSLGEGSGTLVTCFGIPLNREAQNTPAYTKTIDELLADNVPDPEQSGLMPQIKEKIDMIKSLTPDDIKISICDTQGPFNIIHQLVGTDILTAPYLEEEKYHKLMQRVTDLWIGIFKANKKWIGEERFDSTYKSSGLIAECSVNLVSPDFYRDFIAPYDRQVVEALGGKIAIHPCSGPHVFKTTLEELPGVIYTESGWIENTIAGSITTEEALEIIGDRPIALAIGRELPEGKDMETIKRCLDYYRENHRLFFAFTGMHWRNKDRSMIRDMHLELDEYWENEII
ncbi:MAG: uroporphyrinogen decarboxylase family protein [Planctomycetota bacterium]|jgi:hypothetical protein